MPVTQMMSVVGRTGGGTPPPPPYSGTEFFWAGDQDAWYAFGGTLSNSVYSNPVPANPSFTYPDGSYTGKTRNFTGSEWMISTNLGIGGAWPNNGIGINLWFYPTANNCQILSEMNLQDNSMSSYHYSVLEIDSSGYIRARFWNGTGTQSLTSTNTVFLNQWNHIYFAEDTNGGHIFELNGVGTTGLPTYYRVSAGSTSEYFAVGVADTTVMVTSAPFQGKIGYLTIADYVNGSTYSATSTKFRTINSGITLGTTWTVEVIAELLPTSFWATIWGNENYNAGLGHFAYFSGSSANLNVGSPYAQNEYIITDNIATKAHWAFTHADGGGIAVYRNAVLLTPSVSGYAQASPASNTLLFGARHTNDGTGATDPCPGNYYYTNVNNGTALDAAGVQASYDALKTTYGLP